MTIPPLTPLEVALLRSVFRSNPVVTAVRLFGSRAKGTHTAQSDIDLALWGDLRPLQAQAIAAELDDLPLPYRYDVQVFDFIKSDELRDHITRVGLSLYPESDVTLLSSFIEVSFQSLRDGQSHFWEVTRGFSNEELRGLIILGLRESNGSYRKVADLFHLGVNDFHRFMDFLRRRNCAINNGPFRKMIMRSR
jgi:uncharacterized protein